MNDETLGNISASLARIEGTLDGFSGQFTQHVLDDAAVAADVKALRSQRGFFRTGFVAVGVGLGAAVTYAVKRMIGHS
jgi:hypothetical protein